MLRISESSLDWALKHIEKHGDTDVFPLPFEYKVIRYFWEDGMKNYLLDQDLLQWTVRPCRRLLTPKHKYGFRIATQLDPLDCIIFTALVYEIGQDIEKYRISKEDKICFSNRFQPNRDGDMYDTNYNWKEFQTRSKEIITENDDSNPYNYVVVADVADFFPRIYSHPLENALIQSTSKKNYVTVIKRMLSSWNYSVSYGIPVGPSATRLLAEIAIDDVDRALLSEMITHCRFVDDYRMFSKTKIEAYKNLAILANTLFENHGLTLQQHKTRILTKQDFEAKILISEEKKATNNLTEKFLKILDELKINLYDLSMFDEIAEKVMPQIESLNMVDILEEQMQMEEIDFSLVSFILIRLGKCNDSTALAICLENIDKLYPIIRVVFTYINELKCLSNQDKSNLGYKFICSIDTSVVGYLEYYRMWLFDLFANDQSWNNKDKYVELYNKYTDEFSKRKLILAMGKANNYPWFKSQKRNLDKFSSWEKRAFLAAVSCLPGDEAKHWYKSVEKRLDVLEKYITKWAIKEFKK